MHLKLISLWQDSHSGSRGMYTTLGLGGRRTLYSMPTLLVFQRTIDILASYHADSLLEATNGSF